MASLIDTNILVYRLDPRSPEKQQVATEILKRGLGDGSATLPHQAIVEFVPAVSRVNPDGRRLLEPAEARREAEELVTVFDVLYPDDELLRIALRGAAAYQLPWFDAHMWAFAERYGFGELLSEDFQHGRLYGTAQVRDPFLP